MAKSFSNRNGYVLMEILDGTYVVSTVYGCIAFLDYVDANRCYRSIINSFI